MCVNAIFNLVINGVLAYFFYQYAYRNPDLAEHGSCWAADGEDNGSPVKFMQWDINVSN